MKKIILLSILLLQFIYAKAQKNIVWFDAGLKVQYGGGGFLNSALFNSTKYDYRVDPGLSFGGKLGINFENSGLAIDVMRSQSSQSFDRLTGTNLDPLKVNWSALDIYTLFRNSKNLGYFEIGPKISLINKVEDNISGSVQETTSSFNKTNFSGVLGFGANLIGNDGRFSGVLGLRFEYGFNDFANPDSNLNPPLGDNSIFTDGYKKTNLVFAGLVFEMNWGIGYYGKAQCGKRSKFIFF